MSPLFGLADAEQAEAAAGQLQDAPRPRGVGLARRRRLVALADALEEGRGNALREDERVESP
jgi:hypothetical protein